MTHPRPLHVMPPAWLAIALAVACAAAPMTSARAQPAPEPAPIALPGGEWLAQAADAARQVILGDTAGFAAVDLSAQRVVKSAPYCADAVHESIQPLGDGNRIVRSHTTRMCRDGDGRTRQEVERGGRRQVWLNDPQAQEAWVLDPQRKTARRVATSNTRLGLAEEAGGGAPMQEFREQMRAYAERMRDWARGEKHRAGATPPTPPTPAAPATPAVPAPGAEPVAIVREVVRQRDGQGRETEQVELRVLRVDAGAGGAAPLPPLPAIAPLPPMPPLPAAVSWASAQWTPRGPGVVAPLGSRDIEGVKANGERTSWTIEAGKVGNEKPIVITREVWTAPELMLTVLSRDHDPRSGESNYRLVNLKRGEPDAALMRVPADYTQQRSPSAPRPPMPPSPPGSVAPPMKG